MLKVMALGAILLINSYTVEPIEIMIGIGNCEYILIEEEAGIKCDITVNCNKVKVKNNTVEVYITLPSSNNKEAQNVKNEGSKE